MTVARGSTRRRALGSATRLALAGALAAPAALLFRAAPALAGDAAELSALRDLELGLAAAYRDAAASGALDREVERAALQFAAQEEEHARALAAMLEDLGSGGRGAEKRVGSRADSSGVAGVETQRELLDRLIALEEELLGAWNEAAERLRGAAVLRTGAQIACSGAQHLVVLRQQAGRDPIPRAFGA